MAEVKQRYGEPKFETARKYLDPLLENIRKTPKSDQPLSVLARFLDRLLCDQINDGDESEPVLRDFWNQPELAETRQQAMLFRDEAKFGDPLYVVKQFGKGRVAVMTTDAGGTFASKKQWTDWPSGKGSPGWVVVAAQMHRYLTGGGDDANRSVGDRYQGEFDPARYEPEVSASLLTADASKATAERKVVLERKPLGRLAMAPRRTRSRRPGRAAAPEPADLRRGPRARRVPVHAQARSSRTTGGRGPPPTRSATSTSSPSRSTWTR